MTSFGSPVLMLFEAASRTVTSKTASVTSSVTSGVTYRHVCELRGKTQKTLWKPPLYGLSVTLRHVPSPLCVTLRHPSLSPLRGERRRDGET